MDWYEPSSKPEDGIWCVLGRCGLVAGRWDEGGHLSDGRREGVLLGDRSLEVFDPFFACGKD